MPIHAEVEGLGTLEFPDGTPDEVVNRTVLGEVRKASLGKESAQAEEEADKIQGVSDWIDINRSVAGRISLGGIGQFAGSVAKDILHSGLPGLDLSTGGFNPMRATQANVAGQPTPPDIEQDIRSSVIKEGLVGAAETIPTIAAGMAVGGPLGMAAAMGSSELERSEGDLGKAAKAAAIGYALPYVGAAGRMAAAKVMASGANRGVAAMADTGLQKAAEFVTSQAAMQTAGLADLMSSEEYRNASPEARSRMVKVATVQNLAFAPMDIAHLPGAPMARRFESLPVQASRALDASAPVGMARRTMDVASGEPVEGQPDLSSKAPPVVAPGGAVLAAPGGTDDALGTMRAMAVSQVMPVEVQAPDVVARETIGEGPRQEAPGGRVSFAAESPELVSNVPDATADAQRAEKRSFADIAWDQLSVGSQEPPTMVPGEAGEGRTPIPEDPASIAEQVRLTADPESSKAATLVTPGETSPDVPQGMRTTKTPHGDVIWNPAKTTEEAVVQAGSGKLFDGTILGQAGDGSKPVSGKNVVTTSTEAARNVVTEIVPDNDPGAVKAAVKAQQAAVPGGKTEVKPAIDVANERLKSKFIPVDDTDAIEKYLESKIDPKLDESGTVFSGVNPNTVLRAALSFYRAGKPAVDAINEAVEFAKRSGKVNEPALRAFLAAGMPAAPPNRRTPAAPGPAPARPLKGLAEADEVFKPVKKPSGLSARRGIEAVRTGLLSKYRPVSELEESVNQAAGRPKPKQDLAAFFEMLKGSSGQAELDVMRFDEAMAPHLRGIDPKDFNRYMLAKRVVDRLTADPSAKQVSDWTIADAQNVLSELNSRLTPEQQRRIEDAGTMYNAHMDEALQRQVTTGRMSQATYDAIRKANEFYAPFKVMTKLVDMETKPQGYGRQVDTQAELTKAITGIHDPDFRLGDMMAAGRQQIAMSRILAEKSLRMTRLAELATHDPNGTFIRKLAPDEQPKRGKADVAVMENGKAVHYEVDPRVAEAVKASGRVTGDIVSKVLGLAGQGMRAGATTFNVVFQGVNLLSADQPRMAMVSKLGVRNPADLYRYPIDFLHAAWSSATGNKLVPGAEPTKLYRDFLESGAAGATVQSYLTPDALTYRPTSSAREVVKTILGTPARFANAIEETTKVMGLKRALRISGSTSGEELARRAPELITEVRRYAGSPDFGRSGQWTEAARLNLLFMFFNARVQGSAADMSRLLGHDGAGTTAATWAKLTTAVGIPTLLAWAYNHRDEYRADYEKLSDNEKRNYWLIPKDKFITNERGEKVRDYWRIPKRETAKLVSNIIETGMQWSMDKDPESLSKFSASALEDLAPVNISGRNMEERAESVISSTNPLIKSGVEFGTGRNTYTHNPLMSDTMKQAPPEDQFTPRTQEAFRKLAGWMPDWAPNFARSPIKLENLTQNLTAGLFTQFMPTKAIEGREGIETWRMLRRFQTQGYTDNPKFREELETLKTQSAHVSVTRERKAQEIVKESGGDFRSALQSAIKEFGRDRNGIERVIELVRQNKAGVSIEDRKLIALAPPERAQYLANHIADMNQAQSRQYLAQMRQKRVLSNETWLELLKLQRLMTNRPPR